VVGIGAEDQLEAGVLSKDAFEGCEHLLGLLDVSRFGGEMRRNEKVPTSSDEHRILIEVDVLPLFLLKELVVGAIRKYRLSVDDHRFGALTGCDTVGCWGMFFPSELAPHLGLLHENDINAVLLEEFHNPLHFLLVVEVGLRVPVLEEGLEGFRI